ncbi:hypothetical protein BJF93_00465 [Xaviernesmea oryzae]|uniref:Uncharacterized protein n=1 Tax=Xaviernesmea oryzae TaxID=464029 RepID=A0A1Q9B0E3_9HYPH|nr:hypothetical protein [Xaviernesmea oryzae]OLP61446.1 hypothetical protein BJF93_00465 [Xaviernesmea oryzae]
MKALDCLRELEAQLDKVATQARQEAAACGTSVFYARSGQDGVIFEETVKGEIRTDEVAECAEHHAAE